MHRRSLGRATALATAGLLAFSGLAFADSVLTDGDAVTVGTQGNVHIGTVAPGATVVVPVSFALRCGNGNTRRPGPDRDLELGRVERSARRHDRVGHVRNGRTRACRLAGGWSAVP